MILEEGNPPYSSGPNCDMFVLYKSLNIQHLTTAFFRRGQETKWRCLAEEEAEFATTVYGILFAPVTSFKYLGRVISAENNDWP